MLTPLAAFNAAVNEQPNEVYLRQPVQGVFTEYTWLDVFNIARDMAYKLQTLGIEPGDKIALWSKNCAQWVMADLAIMMAGAVSVPLYPGQSKTNVHYVLDHCETKLMFVGKHDDEQAVIESIPDHMMVVAFGGYSGPARVDWNTDHIPQAPAEFEIAQPKLNDIMSIIYTSGTTGMPKGVVHNYGAFAFACNNIVEEAGYNKHERSLSLLPLAHVAERVLLEGQSFYAWFSISFCESAQTFVRDLQSVRPRAMVASPRLWSKIQEGILKAVGGQEKLDRLFNVPLLRHFIKRKLLKSMGLDQVRICSSGGSSMGKPLVQWYERLGIEMCESYGMTENLCYGTISLPQRRRVGSVGKPYYRHHIKISNEGEILSKSPALMVGYYKDIESTNAAFTDGFFHTGDKGYFDEDGFLFITGRMDEMFNTSNGQSISPVDIELVLTQHDYIEHVCVMGVGLPQPIAVIELSEQAMSKDRDMVQSLIADHLSLVNAQLEKYQRLDALVITQFEWTVASGLITPTSKVRREAVVERFTHLMNGHDSSVIWAPLENVINEMQA